jgi:hypothetical protein
MKLHLGYPTVTKGHKLTGVTHVAKLTNAHRHPTCSQTNRARRHSTYSQTKNYDHKLPLVTYHKPNQLNSKPTRSKPTISQLIVWKVHVAHDREYHDSLHYVEVAQLYLQVDDSITCQWLRVSILPNIHFLKCTTRRSPQSLSQHFPACKTSTLRFHHCESHIL